MTGFQLDPDALQAVVAKAILEQINDDARDRILQAAVQHLMTPTPADPRYGITDKRTPLQKAFDGAVVTAAEKVIREDPTVQQAIRAAVTPTVMAIASGTYEGLPDMIGEAVARWIQDLPRRD